MAAKLIAILDNGSGKRGGTCDDCGTALRYEYHTDDGGRYGSECIHRHIHPPDWLTFKATRDAKEFNRRLAGFQRMYPIAKAAGKIEYTEFRDGSIWLPFARYGESGQEMVVEQLLADGWQREVFKKNDFALVTNRSTKYVLCATN